MRCISRLPEPPVICIGRLVMIAGFLLATPGLLPDVTVAASRSMAAQEAPLFSGEGYRIDRYRSPTPSRVEGATTVSTRALQRLMDDAPELVILDVINLDYRLGRFLQDGPHHALPGAHWLPNTGQGDLAPRWRDYLLDEALRLVDGDRDRAIVVACKSDCWLSWNAVRRLHRAGFSNLYWYKDGVDTWQDAGLPTRAIEPIDPGFSAHD